MSLRAKYRNVRKFLKTADKRAIQDLLASFQKLTQLISLQAFMGHTGIYSCRNPFDYTLRLSPESKRSIPKVNIVTPYNKMCPCLTICARSPRTPALTNYGFSHLLPIPQSIKGDSCWIIPGTFGLPYHWSGSAILGHPILC